MNDTDLNALLDSAVPDPPRLLAMETLVRQGRRRQRRHRAGAATAIALGALGVVGAAAVIPSALDYGRSDAVFAPAAPSRADPAPQDPGPTLPGANDPLRDAPDVVGKTLAQAQYELKQAQCVAAVVEVLRPDGADAQGADGDAIVRSQEPLEGYGGCILRLTADGVVREKAADGK